MNKKYLKYLYYLPRTLSIIYIIFISLFALDVFSENYAFLETITTLFMHLIPTFILIAATILAWKKELIGGITFILLGILFTIFFSTYNNQISFLIITFPLILIGLLFLFNFKYLNTYKPK